jgi:hypothetical protein
MHGLPAKMPAIRKLLFIAPLLGLIGGLCVFSECRLQRPAPAGAAAKKEAVATPPLDTVSTRDTGREPMVVNLGSGRFSVGAVVFDRNTREITIPAAVNMREGAVEYVLVGENGKVHEAVFTTAAAAQDIHVAALLLGAQPNPDLGPENASATVSRSGAVVTRVEWEHNGPPERIFLNETVNLSDPSTGAISGTLPAGAWLYNGSRIEADGVFAATRHASIISIIRDRDALVNNPGASRDNDEIHTPNSEKLPKLQHPVRIILQLK